MPQHQLVQPVHVAVCRHCLVVWSHPHQPVSVAAPHHGWNPLPPSHDRPRSRSPPSRHDRQGNSRHDPPTGWTSSESSFAREYTERHRTIAYSRNDPDQRSNRRHSSENNPTSSSSSNRRYSPRPERRSSSRAARSPSPQGERRHSNTRNDRITGPPPGWAPLHPQSSDGWVVANEPPTPVSFLVDRSSMDMAPDRATLVKSTLHTYSQRVRGQLSYSYDYDSLKGGFNSTV